MKTKHRLPPKITKFYDEEERELIESIERGEWRPVPNQKMELARARAAARYTLRKDKSISIRLPSADLARIKAKAMEEGLPYQTLIASLIHKYAHKE